MKNRTSEKIPFPKALKFLFFFRDKDGLDKDQALTKAAEMTGIHRTSIFTFLKEKLGGQLEDNTCQLRKRLTVYERMSLEDVDKTRHLIHGEFANFIQKNGAQKKSGSGVDFPSEGNVQVRGFLKNISVLIYDISTLIYQIRQLAP